MDDPTPENGYTVTNGMALTAALLNLIFTSLHARLVAREQLEADFEGLIAEGTGQALEVIQANVAPQLAAINEAVAALNVAIIAAEDKVEELLAGNLPAGNVTFTPAAGVAAGNVQAAIVEVAGDVQAVETRTSAVEAALPGKASAASVAAIAADVAAAVGDLSSASARSLRAARLFNAATFV